ncbi:asparagine synthase-related protein [Streptomyces sp. NPDC055966]|uniref:asparagine synthase-related protein n=1 Tax=Streptomyces sp. NPDC055966 TaxID=3345669 RepID=UPI0035DD4D31
MYASALAAVPHADGETPAEHRQRELQHLSLTRWLRQLLYGKDRLSIVQGLEVRVPYCDHHLVEYAFSVPWALKSRTPYACPSTPSPSAPPSSASASWTPPTRGPPPKAGPLQRSLPA